MKKQSIKLVMKVLILLIPISLISVCMVLVYSKNHYLPIITTNISLDAKIYESQKKDLESIELLAVGSSMTLNNLNSQTLTKNLNVSYYNYSAWGLQISDIRHLLKLITSEYSPKYVLICSTLTDFKKVSNFNLPNALEFKLSTYSRDYFFLRNLSFLSLAKHYEEYNLMKKDTTEYANLHFDEHGGIPLVIPKSKIIKKRWDEKFNFPTKHTEFQYAELTELARFLHTKSIKLIFIQTPMSIRYARNDNERTKLITHFNKCKSIVENNHGIYSNFHNPIIFSDSLFVDQFHLSAHGSQIFTEMVADKILPVIR